jgi:hypothetical protein
VKFHHHNIQYWAVEVSNFKYKFQDSPPNDPKRRTPTKESTIPVCLGFDLTVFPQEQKCDHTVYQHIHLSPQLYGGMAGWDNLFPLLTTFHTKHKMYNTTRWNNSQQWDEKLHPPKKNVVHFLQTGWSQNLEV